MLSRRRLWQLFCALVVAVAILYTAPDTITHSLTSNLNTYIYLYGLYTGEPLDARPSTAAKFLMSMKLFNGYENQADIVSHPPNPSDMRSAMDRTFALMSPFPSQLTQWWTGITCRRAEEQRSRGIWLSCSKSAEALALFPPSESLADLSLLVLYMHGGGFIEGSSLGYSSFLARIAQFFAKQNMEAVHFFIPEYRLAPEHPLPAAIDDVTEAYLWLLRDLKANPKNVVFMGDSAGGNLVFTVQHNLLTNYPSIPLPRKAIAFSPWLDLTNSMDSRERNNGLDPVLSSSLVYLASNWCSKGNPSALSVYSPIFYSEEELSRFAPTLIQMGDLDVLVDDTRTLMERYADSESSHPFSYEEYPGLPHDFMLVFFGLIPEAEESILSVIEFIRN